MASTYGVASLGGVVEAQQLDNYVVMCLIVEPQFIVEKRAFDLPIIASPRPYGLMFEAVANEVLKRKHCGRLTFFDRRWFAEGIVRRGFWPPHNTQDVILQSVKLKDGVGITA